MCTFSHSLNWMITYYKLFAPQSFILDPELLMNYVNNESIYCHCKDYVNILNQSRLFTFH